MIISPVCFISRKSTEELRLKMEKWRGKFAIVTGASTGIGEAIVKDLAQNGVNVIGLARQSEKIEEIAKSLGETPGTIYARKCDVSDSKSVKAAFKWIEDKFGWVSIVINNAGIAIKGKILDQGDDIAEKMNSVINTNLTGLVHCAREGFRLIQKSDDYGLIVNVNSVLGHSIPYSPGGMNLYAPTKYAVTAVSEVIRNELIGMKNEKIRVTNLSPGNVESNFVVAAGFVAKREQFHNRFVHLQPENISQTVLFLLQTPYNVNITQLTVHPVGAKM